MRRRGVLAIFEGVVREAREFYGYLHVRRDEARIDGRYLEPVLMVKAKRRSRRSGKHARLNKETEDKNGGTLVTQQMKFHISWEDSWAFTCRRRVV